MNLAERAKLIGLVTELTMLAFHQRRLETLPGQLEGLKARLKELGVDPDALEAALAEKEQDEGDGK